MQVAAAAAAATGQPLLAPAPMPFVQYPQAHPHYQQQPYHTQMVCSTKMLAFFNFLPRL